VDNQKLPTKNLGEEYGGYYEMQMLKMIKGINKNQNEEKYDVF
jgi:hypothetical protein